MKLTIHRKWVVFFIFATILKSLPINTVGKIRIEGKRSAIVGIIFLLVFQQSYHGILLILP